MNHKDILGMALGKGAAQETLWNIFQAWRFYRISITGMRDQWDDDLGRMTSQPYTLGYILRCESPASALRDAVKCMQDGDIVTITLHG